MPSMLNALMKGMENYGKSVKTMTKQNTVKAAYEGAKLRNKNAPKAAAKALAGGALVFLAPPVAVGMMAVTDYRKQKQAESQKNRFQQLVSTLLSYGISSSGAQEMASLVIGLGSTGTTISVKDFAMWNLLLSRETSLIQYHSLIAARVERSKSEEDES